MRVYIIFLFLYVYHFNMCIMFTNVLLDLVIDVLVIDDLIFNTI